MDSSFPPASCGPRLPSIVSSVQLSRDISVRFRCKKFKHGHTDVHDENHIFFRGGGEEKKEAGRIERTF